MDNNTLDVLISEIEKEISRDIGGNMPEWVKGYKTGLRDCLERIKSHKSE